MTDEFNIGKVLDKSLQEEMQTSYMEYAMSVIIARALPSAQDGLKPVQRRILYAMQQEGATAGSRYRKCAAFVGEVMKTFHPHGDSAIYDAMVRMAQPFSLRYPLVDGQGNFGSVDGDPPAAMRYCVTGDTLVATPSGTYRIDEITAGMEPNSDRELALEVLGRDGSPVRASRAFHSGSHPTLRLRTREGFELTGTHNHPVLCLVDVLGVPVLLWKLLEEVQAGDHVAMSRTRAATLDADEHELRWALLAGGFVSEGWIGERRACFNNVDPAYFGAILDCYDQVVGGRRYASVRTLRSGRLIYELDVQDLTALNSSRLAELAGLRSAEKKIPASIWHAAPQVKRVFLQALFTGDGSSSSLPRGSIQVSYSTRSPQLAKQVQQMLLEFGVVSKLCRYASGEIKVFLGNRRDARIFCEQVGFLGAKHTKLCDALAAVPVTSRTLSADRIPVLAGYVRAESGSKWVDKDWLNRHNIDRVDRWEREAEQIFSRITSAETRAVVEPLVNAGYYYATVAAVEDAGVQPVYSLKVETAEHAFITNGFVSHNTEARMSAITAEMLADIDKETVDFIPNYTGEDEEPTVLPARIPNLLINGSSGIAVGMTTNIPPHNLNEVASAVTFLIDNPDATSEDLMGFIKGPDFPTGGIIKGISGIKQAYATGHGRIIVRARHRFEESATGRQRIIVEELPYQVNKANLVAKIADLVGDRKLEGIADLNDESDRKGMRIVIELKREARPYTVLNNLYKHTPLQQTFGCIMLALVDGRPVVLGLKQMLQVFIDHRRDVIVRRTRYDLTRAQERAHILEGLKICLDHLDEVIATIRASKDPETASTQLQEKFGLSERQAKAILELRLQRLTQLERAKIDEEYEEVIRLIAYLESILASEQKVLLLIKEEMEDLVKKYGDDRRTEIDVAEATELSAEDLIPKEEVVVTLTHRGYAKRQASRTFRSQRRGGVGLKGARPTAGGEAPTGTREEDYAEHLLITHTHAQILFFTQSGRVFQLHVYEIPERERQAKGTPINNLIEIGAQERITAVFVRPESDDDEAKFMLMVTRRGQIKKTAMREYANVRRNGLIAINLQAGDELEYVHPTSGNDDVLIASEKGKAIRFSEAEVRPMGRDTMGVKGMKLGADDLVAGMAVVKPGAELLVVTQRGFGKRTPLEEYPAHHRAGQGVYTLQVTDKVGRLAAIRVVEDPEEEEILLITASGMVLRTVVEAIRRSSRQTQGVIVMRLQPDDQVVGVAPVGGSDED